MTERILAIPVEAVAGVFTEWERRYRENPESFAEKEDPETYGDACATYFTLLALEVGNGRELEIPKP